ncbi:MAG: hypothetical protein O2780_13695 [Proteobacteria bacterium]|nr:hypothetical protein [Pseudomonadota bacterium]
MAIFLPWEPDERRPGTRLAGEMAPDGQTDFSFLKERTLVYVETRTLYLVPHSITAGAWQDNGKLYVGCSRCDGKYWSGNVRLDNHVRVKIGDLIYRLRAVRLDDEQRRRVLGVPQGEALPDRAVFRMDPV